MSQCSICPRSCMVDRAKRRGFCHAPASFFVARAAPHWGEEPCISGARGSGTVFFSGCNLGCAFCQNHAISRGQTGLVLTEAEFRRTLEQLRSKKVHNLNFVTGAHYAPQIARVLEQPPGLPVVWNSSGYESVSTLRLLEGKVDVYMPDLKFLSPKLAADWCAAPEYPAVAKAAILEMYRQVGEPVFDADGMLQRGLLLRHLVMPGAVENSLDVLDWVAEHFAGGKVVLSLMSQFTPMPGCENFPQLRRVLLPEEYRRVTDYLACLDLPLGYTQELEAATEDWVPDFDNTGLAPGAQRKEL